MGADRFYELVKAKYYDKNGFFRIVRGFVVQVRATLCGSSNSEIIELRQSI